MLVSLTQPPAQPYLFLFIDHCSLSTDIMAFYHERILPHLIDAACSTRQVMKVRKRLVPLARGQVLEVGMGSGINLSLYDAARVERVWALEPSAGMRRKAASNLKDSPVPVDWLDLPGEQIPLPDNSVDTVLLTFTLCTIPDWEAALWQMKRVLKPDGKLLFAEHGRSPDGRVCKLQDRLTPIWRKFAGGCHLNRPIDECILQCGFRIEQHETFYLKKTPRFIGHLYLGQAVKRQ